MDAICLVCESAFGVEGQFDPHIQLECPCCQKAILMFDDEYLESEDTSEALLFVSTPPDIYQRDTQLSADFDDDDAGLLSTQPVELDKEAAAILTIPDYSRSEPLPYIATHQPIHPKSAQLSDPSKDNLSKLSDMVYQSALSATPVVDSQPINDAVDDSDLLIIDSSELHLPEDLTRTIPTISPLTQHPVGQPKTDIDLAPFQQMRDPLDQYSKSFEHADDSLLQPKIPVKDTSEQPILAENLPLPPEVSVKDTSEQPILAENLLLPFSLPLPPDVSVKDTAEQPTFSSKKALETKVYSSFNYSPIDDDVVQEATAPLSEDKISVLLPPAEDDADPKSLLAQTSVTANAQIASSIFSNKFKALDDMLSLENIAKQLDSAIASTLPDMSNYADVSFEPFPNNSDLLTDDEDASIETVMVSESEMTQGEEFPSEPEYLSSNRTLLEGDTAISFESNSQNTFNFLVEKDPFSRDYPNLDEDLDVVTNDWPEVQMEPSAEDLRLSTIIEPTEETFGDVVINEHHTLDLNESNIGFIQRDELEVCSEIAPETSDFDIQELEKMSIDYGDIKIAPQKQNKTVQPSLLDDDIDIELDAPSVISEEYLNAKSSSFDALFGVGKSPIHQQEHKITQPESPKNSIERAFVAHKITDPQLDVNKSSSKTKPKIQNDWGKQTIAYGASLIPEELVATSDEVTTSTSQTASKEDHSVFEPNDESSDILALGPDDLVDDSLEPIDVPGQVDVISAESLIPAEILTKKDLLPDEDSDPVHSLKHGDKLSEVAPLSEHDLEQGGRPSGGHPAPFIEERKHSRSDEHHVDFDAFSRGFFDAPVSELQSEHDAEILAMAQQQKEEARQILNRILVIAPMILLGVAIMLWGIHYTVTQSKQQQQTLTSDDDPLTIDYKSRKPGTSQTEKPINKSLPSLPIPDVTPTPSTQIPEDTDASTTDVSMNKPVVEDRITPPPPIAEKPAIETRITPPPPIAEKPAIETRITPPPPIAEKPVVETRITPPPPPIAEKPVVETRITPSEKTTKTPIPPTKPKVAIAPPPKRKILRTPKRPKANRALAIRYYKEAQKAFFGGNLNTALRLSQLSIRADNRYPDAYLTQGLTYMRMQKKPQARATLQRFLKLAPKHQNAAMVKGLIGQLN